MRPRKLRPMPTSNNGTSAATTVPKAPSPIRLPLRLRPLAKDHLGKWVYTSVGLLFVIQIIMLVLFDIL